MAGGGVGGLTATLCILKTGFDVTVYEKTAAFARYVHDSILVYYNIYIVK